MAGTSPVLALVEVVHITILVAFQTGPLNVAAIVGATSFLISWYVIRSKLSFITLGTAEWIKCRPNLPLTATRRQCSWALIDGAGDLIVVLLPPFLACDLRVVVPSLP